MWVSVRFLHDVSSRVMGLEVIANYFVTQNMDAPMCKAGHCAGMHLPQALKIPYFGPKFYIKASLTGQILLIVSEGSSLDVKKVLT